MKNTYYEYGEFEVPEEIFRKLEQSAIDAQSDPNNESRAMTLGQAGFTDWLTELSKEDGWEVVSVIVPYVIVKRKISK